MVICDSIRKEHANTSLIWKGRCQSLGILQIEISQLEQGLNSTWSFLSIQTAKSTWWNQTLLSTRKQKWMSQYLTSFLEYPGKSKKDCLGLSNNMKNDQVLLPMRDISDLTKPKLSRHELQITACSGAMNEPVLMRLLSTPYEFGHKKADLQSVVSDNCTHLCLTD